MARASSIAASFVLTAALGASGPAAAAGNAAPADAAKRAGNSFTLLYTASVPSVPSASAGPGAGVPLGKAVVTNPNNVPLLQNAGALRIGR